MIPGMSSNPVNQREPLLASQFHTENLNVFHQLFLVNKKELLVSSFPVSADTLLSVPICVIVMLS